MNKTKIEWTDYTWNPIVGCKHGCWYCYAKKLTQRFKKIFPNGFEPTFHPERLTEPWERKKPSKIFVCSIADLFAPWTPIEWRDKVFSSMYHCPTKHYFQLLTKNPEKIPLYGYSDTGTKYNHPDNWWFGTTVTNRNDDWKNIEAIKKVPAKVRFVSFEPLLESLPRALTLRGIQWVIIGKLTGSRKVLLRASWVDQILKECQEERIPVFMKNNLVPPLEKTELIQQFPFENVAEAVAL